MSGTNLREKQTAGRSGSLRVRLKQSKPFAIDVAFEVDPGEVVALIGCSGSGKTTTLRAIAGLVKPDEGYVLSGADVWFDSAQKICLRPEVRRVGFVFQDYALFPHLTISRNVSLAMKHLPEAEREGAAAGLLARVGLTNSGAQLPHRLSGGERQRVAIARALARQPGVLLLDEPFSAVDRPAREVLKREVKDLAAGLGIPVVLVTHDISEAIVLSRRLIIIDEGRTIAEGLTGEIEALRQDPRIAAILGPLP